MQRLRRIPGAARSLSAIPEKKTLTKKTFGAATCRPRLSENQKWLLKSDRRVLIEHMVSLREHGFTHRTFFICNKKLQFNISFNFFN
jgi:hypothetical protein